MQESVSDLANKIANLTLLQAKELVDELKKLGFEPTAAVVAGPAAQTPASGTAPAAGAAPKESTEFDLILTSGGDKKLQVIKVVRDLKKDLGLKEAKDLVDGAPKKILEKVEKSVAEEAKKKLTEAGAVVEVKGL